MIGLIAGLVYVLVSCGGAQPAPGSFPPLNSALGSSPLTDLDEVRVRATRIAATGEMATALTSDPDRQVLFVAQRSGRILQVRVDRRDGMSVPVLNKEPVLDLSEQISTGGERGLFDLLLAPDGEHVLASLSGLDGAITVRLLRLDGDKLVDDVEVPEVVTIPHTSSRHYGGGLTFTADGDVLLALGDMDMSHSRPPPSQNPESLHGGIVRIPAAVLETKAARPWEAKTSDLVAKGLRNPWRIDLDRTSDRLWIADVGHSEWEEINVTDTASVDGPPVNFGWPAFEGDSIRHADLMHGLASEPVAPIHKYRHGDNACAIVGGGLYRGRQISGLDGAYLYGDFCSGSVMAVRMASSTDLDVAPLVEVPGNVVSFGQDAMGERYVLTADGEVFRLDPENWDVREVPSSGSAPTTTVPVTPTAAECELTGVLSTLGSFRSLSREDLEARVLYSRELIEAAIHQAPDERKAQLRSMLLATESLLAALRTDAREGSETATNDLLDELLSGEGRGTGFPEAVSEVMAVSSGCQ